MWMYFEESSILINLDKINSVSKHYDLDKCYVILDGDDFRETIYLNSKEQCKKYVELLVMHMSSNTKVIYHEDIVKGLGVE